MQPIVNIVILSRSHTRKGLYPGVIYNALKLEASYIVKKGNSWLFVPLQEAKEVALEKPKLTLYEVYKKLNMKISIRKYGVAL